MPQVREYQEQDQSQIIQLLTSVFPGWPRIDTPHTPQDYWNWKYTAAPNTENMIAVAEHQDQIIGCLHTIPHRYKGPQGQDKCATGTDLAVHPDHRGTGLGLQLADKINQMLTEAGYKFTYSITGNPKLTKGIPRGQTVFPGEVINYAKINDIDRQLHAYPMSHEWLIKAGFHTLKGLTRLKKAIKGGGEQHVAEEADSFGPETDTLWKQVETKYRFAATRTSDYLNWRYCDPRAGGYEIRKTYTGDKLTGYCVFRANRHKAEYPVGFITELVTAPRRPDVAHTLVQSVDDWMSDADVNIVNFQGMEASPTFKVLESHGYLNTRIKITILLKPLVPLQELDSILGGDPRRIMISWGDHDVLPVSTGPDFL